MTTTTNTRTAAAADAEPELPTGKVLVGDAVQRLRELADHSVDTVITSPPYFRLRNYGVAGQIGLEESVDEWVAKLRAVLTEVARVLKPEGSVWLNLGDRYSRRAAQGAAPKGLVLAPERLLLALETDGWSVRNKVVWAKPNGLPSSVKDRLTNTWEPVYLLTRSPSYFFDLDAIRIPPVSKLNGPSIVSKHAKYSASRGVRPAWSGPEAGVNTGLDAMKARGETSHRLGKNPGDWWIVPTASYRGEHFATFPKGLIERPIKATCPERVCATCGTAWRRLQAGPAIGSVAVLGALRKSCGCDDRSHRPGLVLDPFFGAGTVGVVAEKLSRRWIGIELNPTYADLARQRIAAAGGQV